MTVGSLFSGIGGFDLGFERAGFEIKWQVEIDQFCRRVLAQHWPDVRRYRDVRTVGSELERVDVVCGGFPCQPVSVAGKQRAQADPRWLWPAFARVIGAVRPRYVVVENVPGLLIQALGTVLGDLAALGYDAEWDCLPACAVGAPHRRDRVWLVAYPGRESPGASKKSHSDDARIWSQTATQFRECTRRGRAAWAAEPNVGRVAHGVPARVDRLRGLGNSIVPQIAEWIAERIKDAEAVAR